VWRRLLTDTALPVEHQTVAWQLLHGKLLVGALCLRASPPTPGCAGYMAAAQACCSQCASAGRPDQLETYTHAFMDCPAVSTALAWLLEVYEALTGTAPPRDPLVLLADAHWRWRTDGAPGRLWQRLRVLFLGAVWLVRSNPPRDKRPPHQDQAPDAAHALAIIQDILTNLQRGVRRDWLRVLEDPRSATGNTVPSAWFKGLPPTLTLDQFQALWPDCGEWFATTEGVRHVHIRLSLEWPLPVLPRLGLAPVQALPHGLAGVAAGAAAGPPPAPEEAPANPADAHGVLDNALEDINLGALAAAAVG
jgi:hypothetical protein